MEIRIKTHDEARDGRVTIEIDGGRMYTDQEMAAAQTSEAQVTVKGEDQRFADLKRVIGGRTKVTAAERNEYWKRITELDAELTDARRDLGIVTENWKRANTRADEAITERDYREAARARLENELERRTSERDQRESARASLEAELTKTQFSIGHLTNERNLWRTRYERVTAELDRYRDTSAEIVKAKDALTEKMGQVQEIVHDEDLSRPEKVDAIADIVGMPGATA